MKNKIILQNKNIIAYICLVHFLINMKIKINCKTKLFLNCVQHIDCNIQHGGPHLDSWRAAGWEPLL